MNSRKALRLVLAVSAFATAASSAAYAQEGTDEPKKSDMDNAVQSTIFRGDPVSNAYDDVQKWKKDNGVPIEIGAWHWWHMFRNPQDDSRRLQYGKRGLEGTYYYYLKFDPSWDNGAGTKFGLHVDARARDSFHEPDPSFRPFFKSNLWLWEAYGWVEACDTTFKAGKIWRRFGMDWDGSWYGNVAYFDGWKLDPDWGASAERTFDFGHGVTAPSFAQFFFAEDRVNGSVGSRPDSGGSGADPESDERSREKLSFNVRTVPTWTMSNKDTVALGLSALAEQVDSRTPAISAAGTSSTATATRDHWVSAAAVDLTYTHGKIKAFGEWMKWVGERHPNNYVTAGPSTRGQDWELGAACTHGFATFRASVSHGNYDNPGGSQILYLLGVDLAVTKNVTFIVEWVRWDDKQQRGAPRFFAEDGINFILNWRF